MIRRSIYGIRSGFTTSTLGVEKCARQMFTDHGAGEKTDEWLACRTVDVQIGRVRDHTAIFEANRGEGLVTIPTHKMTHRLRTSMKAFCLSDPSVCIMIWNVSRSRYQRNVSSRAAIVPHKVRTCQNANYRAIATTYSHSQCYITRRMTMQWRHVSANGCFPSFSSLLPSLA